MPAIEVENLTKRYGARTAIDSISFTVPDGSIVGIIGPLSKGYRQRVGLADALVHKPKVLILDEPTSGLDPNQVRDVRDLVKEIAGDTTILFSTHTIPWVEQVCRRVIIINQGRIVREGDLDEVRAEVAPWSRVEFRTSLSEQDAMQVLATFPRVRFY